MSDNDDDVPEAQEVQKIVKIFLPEDEAIEPINIIEAKRYFNN